MCWFTPGMPTEALGWWMKLGARISNQSPPWVAGTNYPEPSSLLPRVCSCQEPALILEPGTEMQALSFLTVRPDALATQF